MMALERDDPALRRRRSARWPALYILTFFVGAGALGWAVDHSPAQLVFFTLIGVSVASGFLIHARVRPNRKRRGRRLSPALVGLSLFLGAGVFGRQSFQLEGFFFYVFAGVFGGVVTHYLVAKIVGPLLIGRGYYLTGVGLAIALEDNRAFCKYVCPVTVFLRAGNRLALLKVKGAIESCTECGACDKVCPMDVPVLRFVKAGTRVLDPECTLCQSCIGACAEGSLRLSLGFDLSRGRSIAS